MSDYLDCYRSGISAIQTVTADLGDRDWHRTVCGDWSAHELARHLLAVTELFHRGLDRAIEGDATAPFPPDQLEDRNELAVYEHRNLDGPAAIESFAISAQVFIDRAATTPDLMIGLPAGPVPVSTAIGLGAHEWHLHAWDLGAGRYRPEAPDLLVRAIIEARRSTTPRDRWRQRRAQRKRRRVDPWDWLLADSGREPKISQVTQPGQ